MRADFCHRMAGRGGLRGGMQEPNQSAGQLFAGVDQPWSNAELALKPMANPAGTNGCFR